MRATSEMLAASLLALLMAGLAGCSKRQDAPNAEPGGKPSGTGAVVAAMSKAPFAPALAAPAHGISQNRLAAPNSSTEVPTGIPVSAGPSKVTNVVPIEAGPPFRPPVSASEVVHMLKTVGDTQAAVAAIRQLATNNPACFPELLDMLRASDPATSMLGAEGLASLGTREAAAELISAIQNAPPGLSKRQLSTALANLSNPEVSDLFLSLMRSAVPDRELAAAAQTALGNSANEAVLQQVIQRYQASYSPEEKDNLIGAIRHSQNPRCVDALLGVLNSQSEVSAVEPLGLAAADTLGMIGTTNAVAHLFAYLDNLRSGGTSPVCDSIGRVSNPDALQLVASVAYGQVPGSTLRSRMAAVQALGNYDSSLVAPALNWLVQNDADAGIKEAARGALQRTAAR